MARLLSGTAQYIEATSHPTGSSTGKITVSVWLKHTNTPLVEQYTMCDGSNGTEVNYSLSADPGSGGYRFVYTTGITTYVAFSTTDSFDNGVWHNVIFAGDYSTAGSKFYKDGVSQSFSNTFGTPGSPSVNFAKLTIGGFSQGGVSVPVGLFDGTLADVAAWNVILTAGEAASLAMGIRPSAIRPASLISWHPLDGIESPEPDLSNNANNGVVTGAILAAGPPITLFTPRWPNNELPTSISAAAGFGALLSNKRSQMIHAGLTLQ